MLLQVACELMHYFKSSKDPEDICHVWVKEHTMLYLEGYCCNSQDFLVVPPVSADSMMNVVCIIKDRNNHTVTV